MASLLFILPDKLSEDSYRGHKMNRTFKKIALSASILILLLFSLFVINQTSQVVQLAEKVSPSFGNFVFWTLLLVYAVLILIPVFLFFRLPRSLMPPKSEDSPEFDAYFTLLKKRLASNPQLKGLELSDRQQVDEALAILAEKSDKIIQQTASTVFISTAISQSGRLDAFLVLSAQSRMVWRIARLYYQRPTLRDIIQLYANVAGTAFLASEFEDVDISEQVEPVLSSTLGALVVTIPGVQLAASTGRESLADYLPPWLPCPCQEAMGMLQISLMVGVAQLAEHRVVAPAVAGSSPVVHPSKFEGLGQ